MFAIFTNYVCHAMFISICFGPRRRGQMPKLLCYMWTLSYAHKMYAYLNFLVRWVSFLFITWKSPINTNTVFCEEKVDNTMCYGWLPVVGYQW